ncbi:MAG: hypothetical protein V4565_12680 [Bacteroidota bacterium]
MKAAIVCIILALMHLSFVIPSDKKDGKLEPIPAESAWIKSEVGIWIGNYNVWYKFDKKDNRIKLSYNKKKWTYSSSEAVWHDRSDRWICRYNDKLMCSENGTIWKEVTNRTWQDIHGTWYRFDSSWDLWEVKL